jgi:predicted AlkP superfamily pyrophosphatase or phosphodiesterase
VLWITVDQMRGDFLDQFAHHLQPGGFERLLKAGAYYPNAHHRHGITETAPGHATLFTGAFPADHGIVGNSWFDRAAGQEVPAVLDVRAPLLGTDLPEALAPETGRSPRRLLLPTLGDALTAATSGAAKIVAVSTKDRAAILPGGATGKAFWLGPTGFVTSTYYFDALPTWVARFNQEVSIESFRGRRWELLRPAEHYRRLAQDDRPAERPLFGLGRTFPHPIDGAGPLLASALSATPLTDELTVDFALRALREEGLGRDATADLLAISLSATDMVGHAYGPESLEAEDNFARLDRQLARLLAEVDAAVGLDHTLVVLSADHGACATAEHSQELGFEAARIEPSDVLATAQEAARRRFGDGELVLGFTNPTLWIDRAKVRRRGLDEESVARAVAEAVSERDDVYAAWAVADLLRDAPPSSRAAGESAQATRERARLGLHPGRSGDVYVVPRPYSLLLQGADIAATHGSPWRYDSHVPVILSGPGIVQGVFSQEVGPHQLPATVARQLGITPPAGASPEPL